MLIKISIPKQTLELYGDDGACIRRYAISTAANGAGEQKGSFCTPRGQHIVRAKIGEGQLLNAVFRGRRFTGEIWSADLAANQPDRDWILSRILWLSGCEHGFNRLGNVDSMQRYIYIHGTPDTEQMSIPASHGCVRMRNAEIIELYDLVPPYTIVDISA